MFFSIAWKMYKLLNFTIIIIITYYNILFIYSVFILFLFFY